MACQKYLGGIDGSKTLHVGDQFLSAGANDFKVRNSFLKVSHFGSYILQARLACTTAWIASPVETVQLLDELAAHTQAEDLERRDNALKVLRARS